MVLKKRETKYICILDAIDEAKNYIYPGYTDNALGSGKVMRMSAADASCASDEIVYINNDVDITTFDNFNAAKSD